MGEGASFRLCDVPGYSVMLEDLLPAITLLAHPPVWFSATSCDPRLLPKVSLYMELSI